MSRRRQSSKTTGMPSHRRTLSQTTSLRGMMREEIPALPEMPSFFPDPVALDAEDCHLKVLRDELFRREYDVSRRAIYHIMQDQLEQYQQQLKQRQKRCGSMDGSRSFSELDGLRLMNREGEESHTKAPSLERGLSFSTATLPALDTEALASLRSAGAAEERVTPKKNKKETTIQKGSPAELTRGQELGTLTLSFFTRPSDAKTGLYKEEGSLLRPNPFTQPVFLGEPFPASLFALAEEVGMMNPTTETRDAVRRISEAQKILGLNILPSLTVSLPDEGPSTQGGTLGGNGVGLSSALDAISRMASPQAIPSPRFLSTFPLADAFVLEAEEHLAAEMFCESICEDIVKRAAEMYVSRTFDSMATAYTAFSVWDEVYNSVVHSFIPHSPQESILEESLPAALVPPIRRIKPKKKMAGAVVSVVQVDATGKSQIMGTAMLKNREVPYLGLLPEWAPTPSLLDADAILSFHHRGKETSRPFTVEGASKLRGRLGGRRPSSTFSEFLNASLKLGKKQEPQPVSGIIKRRFNPFKPVAKKSEEKDEATYSRDSDSPGIPPQSIPVDNYARYALPKAAETLKENEEKREGEEEANGASSQVRSSKQRINDKANIHVERPSDSYRKEGGVEEESRPTPSKGSASVPGDVLGKDNSSTGKNKSKKRRKENISTSEVQPDTTTGTELSTRAQTPGQNVDDDLTKALRQLPRGYLSPSMTLNTSSINTTTTTGASHRITVPDALVFIEDDHATIFSTSTKKKNEEKTSLSGVRSSRASKSFLHGGFKAAPSLHDSVINNDGNATLSVNIMKGGQTTMNLTPIAATQEGETKPETELVQEDQAKENWASSHGGRYLILSRKQQKALEERQRRQREAAEQAAYESMFVTQTLPPSKGPTEEEMNLDTDGAINPHSDNEQSRKIVPEPGVIVERWPTIQAEKDAKKAKMRGRKAKMVQQQNAMADMDVVLADGGEWILPEGKYRWSDFDPAAEESSAAVPIAAAVRESKGEGGPRTVTSAQKTRLRPAKEKDAKEDAEGGGTSTTRKSNAKPTVKIMGRTPRQLPAVVTSMQKGGKMEKNEEHQTTMSGTAEDESSNTAKSGIVAQKHGKKYLQRSKKLPRLPHRPLDSDQATHDTPRSLKTPQASDVNKIRQLASILKKN